MARRGASTAPSALSLPWSFRFFGLIFVLMWRRCSLSAISFILLARVSGEAHRASQSDHPTVFLPISNFFRGEEETPSSLGMGTRA